MKFSFQKKNRSSLYRIFSLFLSVMFFFGTITPLPIASAQTLSATVLNLPAAGNIVSATDAFAPAMIEGITINPEDPLQFDFIVDLGNTDFRGDELYVESKKMVKYFLAALTIPEADMWVNLSPYEKNRIIPQGFGDTEMGRDMLAQDYLLKQLTASMMYPEDELGQKFWSRIYKKALDQYGTTQIPINTFNKVWIVPEKAVVLKQGNSVVVVESHLKVMLEEDYIALEQNLDKSKYGMGQISEDETKKISEISSEVVRNILIPEIEKEVNQGKVFANLRQIYNALILATWYKKNLKESLLGQVYVDQNKTLGVHTEDKQINQKIYDQYVEAFKTGVYDYIRADYDDATQSMVPRKYFSGGVNIFKFGETVFSAVGSPLALTPQQQDRISHRRAGKRIIVDANMFGFKPDRGADVSNIFSRNNSVLNPTIQSEALSSPVIGGEIKLTAVTTHPERLDDVHDWLIENMKSDDLNLKESKSFAMLDIGSSNPKATRRWAQKMSKINPKVQIYAVDNVIPAAILYLDNGNIAYFDEQEKLTLLNVHGRPVKKRTDLGADEIKKLEEQYKDYEGDIEEFPYQNTIKGQPNLHLIEGGSYIEENQRPSEPIRLITSFNTFSMWYSVEETLAHLNRMGEMLENDGDLIEGTVNKGGATRFVVLRKENNQLVPKKFVLSAETLRDPIRYVRTKIPAVIVNLPEWDQIKKEMLLEFSDIIPENPKDYTSIMFDAVKTKLTDLGYDVEITPQNFIVLRFHDGKLISEKKRKEFQKKEALKKGSEDAPKTWGNRVLSIFSSSALNAKDARETIGLLVDNFEKLSRENGAVTSDGISPLVSYLELIAGNEELKRDIRQSSIGMMVDGPSAEVIENYKLREQIVGILGMLDFIGERNTGEYPLSEKLKEIANKVFRINKEQLTKENFTKFISTSPKRLRDAVNANKPVVFVLGHVSPDMDSMESAKFTAWRNHLMDGEEITYIPVAQGAKLPLEIVEFVKEKSDINLDTAMVRYRPEENEFYSILEDETPGDVFLTPENSADEDKSQNRYKFSEGSFKYILVDYNDDYVKLQERVINIIDHHKVDELTKKREFSMSVNIKSIGATMALVYNDLRGLGADVDFETLTLIQATIVDDTKNRDPGKMNGLTTVIMDSILEKTREDDSDSVIYQAMRKVVWAFNRKDPVGSVQGDSKSKASWGKWDQGKQLKWGDVIIQGVFNEGGTIREGQQKEMLDPMIEEVKRVTNEEGYMIHVLNINNQKDDLKVPVTVIRAYVFPHQEWMQTKDGQKTYAKVFNAMLSAIYKVINEAIEKNILTGEASQYITEDYDKRWIQVMGYNGQLERKKIAEILADAYGRGDTETKEFNWPIIKERDGEFHVNDMNTIRKGVRLFSQDDVPYVVTSLGTIEKSGEYFTAFGVTNVGDADEKAYYQVLSDSENNEKLRFSSIDVKQYKPASSALLNLGELKKGGIDFNPDLFDMKTRGNSHGIIFPVSQRSMSDIQVEGFFPVINNIVPLGGSLLFYLGMKDVAEEEKAASLRRFEIPVGDIEVGGHRNLWVWDRKNRLNAFLSQEVI